MNQASVILFTVPIACILIVVVRHFWDEIFKKEFVIERRSAPTVVATPILKPQSVVPKRLLNRRQAPLH